ncbi:HAMP domain-containing sensor histidine kinase [Lutispora sp.]|uniref:HAMP domain-containing sensor histidine kinase n=1 Tax=Lutispora sp. TaxID=2828727 RepID=UPI002B1E981B|nr:HAMP domain-containing sensor histidine kinase [Lutispora sp.]MEA4962986.1 HAMP domain-containing sensor histidine kinase [Lutispora sp.]
MKVRFSPFWLVKPLIWLMKPMFWLIKKLLWPIKQLSRPLGVIFRAIRSRIKASIRMQLILTFTICLLLSITISSVAFVFFADYTKKARIEYVRGKDQIDEAAKYIAERLVEDSFLQLDYGAIQEVIDDAVGEHSYKVIITDVDGRVLYKSKNAEETEIDLYNVIENAMGLRTEQYDKEVPLEYYSFYPSQINQTKVYVIGTGVPEASIVYRTNEGLGVVLAAITAFVSVFAISFQMLTRKKMKYIEELAAGLRVISTGNLDFRVVSKGSDEMASFADNINSMAEELKRKIEEERRAEKTKNELITNISHDLRTPLTSIMGYLKLVSDKKYENDKQLKEYINIAYGKSEKLKILIDDLFEYTKISGQGVRLNITDVNISELLEQLVEELVPIGEENGLEFVKQIPNEKMIARVDADLIARAFENLLMNAIRYSYKPGKILVMICRQNGKVLICIENNGDAIPSDELHNLFDRFYRLEKSRSAGTGGSGLGLAIAKNIVDLHHGDIWAECEGNIIRFFVGLPLGPLSD